MVEVLKVSPFVEVGGTKVDVRNVIREIKPEEPFNAQTLKDLLGSQVPENIEAYELLNLIQAMYSFAYIRFGYKGMSAYSLISVHNPEEMVTVERTEGPLMGSGGSWLVPEALVSEQWPKADGWNVVARHELIEEE